MNLTIVVILAVVFLLGCLGGLVNWVFFSLPPRKGQSTYGLWYYTYRCPTRFPGLVTNVLLGGVGALVFWCLHGPYSGAVLIGTEAGTTGATLTVGQIPISFLIGMGGGSYILNEARRRCAEQPPGSNDKDGSGAE
jgi:hypothetical protein